MSGYQLCAMTTHRKKKHLVRGRKPSGRQDGAYEYSTECGKFFVALDPKEPPDPNWALCGNCALTERGKAFLRKRGG